MNLLLNPYFQTDLRRSFFCFLLYRSSFAGSKPSFGGSILSFGGSKPLFGDSKRKLRRAPFRPDAALGIANYLLLAAKSQRKPSNEPRKT